MLKNINHSKKQYQKYVLQHKNTYICIVFFMVLDLRLTIKDWLS